MVALRSAAESADGAPAPSPPWPDPADWLSLQQAACELNVSHSTVRRMIRKGLLRNRIVPRRGGFRYLIYLPNSRHAQMQTQHSAAASTDAQPRRLLRLVDCAPAGPRRGDLADNEPPGDDVRHFGTRIEHLSRALARALLIRQTPPPGAAIPNAGNLDGPYARYRWLARHRRRWWHIS